MDIRDVILDLNEVIREHEMETARMKNIVVCLNQLEVLKKHFSFKAVYIGDTGMYDGCTKGVVYDVIQHSENKDRLIVLQNDNRAISELSRCKFTFPFHKVNKKESNLSACPFCDALGI